MLVALPQAWVTQPETGESWYICRSHPPHPPVPTCGHKVRGSASSSACPSLLALLPFDRSLPTLRRVSWRFRYARNLPGRSDCTPDYHVFVVAVIDILCSTWFLFIGHRVIDSLLFVGPCDLFLIMYLNKCIRHRWLSQFLFWFVWIYFKSYNSKLYLGVGMSGFSPMDLLCGRQQY